MALIKSISGIRGTIGGKPGENLTPIDIVKFATAYGSWLKSNNKPRKVVIGRDARLSGEMVQQLVSSSLIGMGIDVVDLGLSTTPTVEVAVTLENAGGGIIITASHNPVQWNALKLLNDKGEFLSAKDGEDLLQLVEENSAEYAEVLKLGKTTKMDNYIDLHINMILEYPLVNKKAIEKAGFKVVVDSVNSTGGIAVPKLLRALGVKEIKELNCEPSGHFAHNPEPLPENLNQIISQLQKGNHDLGIVVDPDVDRLALICEDGTPFGEEYTLVSVADFYLKKKPGNTVSNMSSTRALKDVTLNHGQSYSSSAVGEVNVVERMKATDAVIGGEGNGGIIVSDFHYGRDALIGIALFLTHLAETGMKASKLRASYPNYHISKNKIELMQGMNVDAILDSVAKKYKKYGVNREDGVKIEFDQEWAHLRKSNTEPIIRIYTESASETTAETLAQKIISDIKELVTVHTE